MPFIDDPEPSAVDPIPESRAIVAVPAISSEDLAPLRSFIDSFRDIDELDGQATWNAERFGPLPPYLTLFHIAESEWTRAIAFYEQQVLRSVGRCSEHLLADPLLGQDMASLKEAWAMSTALHRRLEACISRIRDSSTPSTERQALSVRRDELSATISTAVAQIGKITRVFYDRYGK